MILPPASAFKIEQNRAILTPSLNANVHAPRQSQSPSPSRNHHAHMAYQLGFNALRLARSLSPHSKAVREPVDTGPQLCHSGHTLHLQRHPHRQSRGRAAPEGDGRQGTQVLHRLGYGRRRGEHAHGQRGEVKRGEIRAGHGHHRRQWARRESRGGCGLVQPRHAGHPPRARTKDPFLR